MKSSVIASSNPKYSREKLMEAATTLFANKGFAAVSIRELALEAGTNSGMISYYFGGKEGLYAEVLESQFKAFFSALMPIFKNETDTMQKIKEFSQTLSSLHKESPCLMRLYYSELTNPTACFETIVKKYIAAGAKMLENTIAQGISEGNIKKNLNPSYAALALAGMLNYYFIVQPVSDGILPDSPNRDEEYLEEVLQIYLNGVKAK